MDKKWEPPSRIELPVATRHRRDVTGQLLKVALNQDTHTLATYFLQTPMI